MEESEVMLIQSRYLNPLIRVTIHKDCYIFILNSYS